MHVGLTSIMHKFECQHIGFMSWLLLLLHVLLLQMPLLLCLLPLWGGLVWLFSMPLPQPRGSQLMLPMLRLLYIRTQQ